MERWSLTPPPRTVWVGGGEERQKGEEEMTGPEAARQGLGLGVEEMTNSLPHPPVALLPTLGSHDPSSPSLRSAEQLPGGRRQGAREGFAGELAGRGQQVVGDVGISSSPLLHTRAKPH